MATVFISPSRYIQGAGELKNLGKYATNLGKKALCLISAGGYKRHGNEIESSFSVTEGEVIFDYFNGECSMTEIQRLSDKVKETSCDLVIGVGGGKIFDTAKAVAYYTNLPVIICPTIASTDAPCSALSVIYTDEGVFQKYLFLPSNPQLVLMDTDVIAKSPVRLTVSGMGDAIAELCYDTLISEGIKAKLALEAGACTTAVEKIIEANTLLSGIGFESGGLAGAHAIHNGLTVLEECHHMQHGEKVNFGTLTQLVLENIPEEELQEILEWMIDVGLPVTLSELGITDTSREHLMPVAEAACAENETIYNMPCEISPEIVYNAILAADAYGKLVKGE